MTFRENDSGWKNNDAEDEEIDSLIPKSGIYENSDG